MPRSWGRTWPTSSTPSAFISLPPGRPSGSSADRGAVPTCPLGLPRCAAVSGRVSWLDQLDRHWDVGRRCMGGRSACGCWLAPRRVEELVQGLLAMPERAIAVAEVLLHNLMPDTDISEIFHVGSAVTRVGRNHAGIRNALGQRRPNFGLWPSCAPRPRAGDEAPAQVLVEIAHASEPTPRVPAEWTRKRSERATEDHRSAVAPGRGIKKSAPHNSVGAGQGSVGGSFLRGFHPTT